MNSPLPCLILEDVEVAAGTRELSPGTMLDDKYRIERLLAVGGMGAVYEGTHIKLRKRVAIKVLNPELSSPPMVERFQREAITASQIGHEGIAQVTDIGTSLQNEPFLVMEFLEGESLAARLRATGPLSVEEACELGCAILSPLAAAHAAGIVHRDLKPDNVFLVRQSRGEMVKLLDFGISRAAGLESEFRLTTTGLVLGTPYYMSPEQARGDSYITAACDIYAFGVILYEMLVGTVPIHGDNYNQLMYRVMSGEFVPPRQHRPDLPPALEDIILNTMALDPRARPVGADVLEQRLLAFCRPTFREHTIERISQSTLPRSKAPSVTPMPSGTDRTVLVAPPGSTPAPMPAYAPPPAKKSKALWVILALFLVAGIATAAIVVIGKDSGTVGKPTTETATTETPAAGTPSVGAATGTATPSTGGTAPTTASSTPTTTGSTPTTASSTPVATPPVTTPPAATTVTLRFAVEPAWSKIFIDGKPITGLEISVPRDDASHSLQITAPGHVSHTEELKLDENQRIAIMLKPTPRRTGGKSGGKSGGKTGGKTERIDSTSPYQ